MDLLTTDRYRILARGEAAAELLIYGDIGQSWDAEESNDAKSVVKAIGELKDRALTVRINSYGGVVTDGVAIFNALRRHQGGVTVRIDGIAASIASLIAMAGDMVYMADNASLMIHAPWGTAIGNATDMRRMADTLDKFSAAMTSSYLTRPSLARAQVEGWLTDGEDHWFTADEAAALGLVDVVDEAAPEARIAAAYRGAASRFSIPAAMARRFAEEPPMSADQTSGGPAAPETQSTVDVQAIIAKTEAENSASAASGAKRVIEAQRRFRAAAQAYLSPSDPNDPVKAVLDHCLDNADTITEADAKFAIVEAAAHRTAPILTVDPAGFGDLGAPHPRMSAHTGGARVQLRQDQADKRGTGLTLALSVRCGLETDPDKIRAAEADELIGMSLVQLMAAELRANGMRAPGTPQQVVSAYLRVMPVMASGPSHGGDHLPAVLGNIAEKAMMDGWNAARETWGLWTRPGTLRNFQQATDVAMAYLDKLTRMVPHQEFEYGDLADQKQTKQLYQHGLRYGFPFEAIINDDLGALAEAMRGWGEAASATIGDYVHATLFTAGTGGYGQSMTQDSTLLFHADHSNYIASGSGGVPSEETLNTARTAMMTQTDPNGRKVAAIPRYILHGPALYATVRKVLASQELQSVTVDGSTGATVLSGSINSVRDMNLTPVEDYRIVASAPGAYTWVLASDRRTVEVAGLNGQPRPVAEQIPMGNIWGINYQLTCPFAVTALDHRGLYLNFGA